MKTTVRMNVRKTSYYAALVLYMTKMLSLSGVSWCGQFAALAAFAAKACDFAVPALLCVSFVYDLKYRPGIYHLLCICILGLLSVSAYRTQSSMLLYSAALMLCAHRIEYRKILDVFYTVAVGNLLLLIAANLVGMTESRYITFGYGVANSVGMAHPNNFGSFATTVLLIWCCRNVHRNPIVIILVCIAAAFVTYSVVLSRTSFILMLSSGFLMLLYRLLVAARSVRILRMARFMIFAVFAISIVLMVYSGQIQDSISAHTTFLTRFTSAMSLYKTYGIHPFGSYIEFRSTITSRALGLQAVVLDSAYLYLLISQGSVAALCFFAAVWRIASVLNKNRQYILLAVMALFLIGGLMEQNVLRVELNFLLLAMSSGIGEENVTVQKKDVLKKNVMIKKGM